jgi:capsular polysaccharide export protein
LQFADLIVERAPMAPLIEAVDEVHTITSLAGFEALLRGRRVVVHGQPFYAGWGLTEDLAPLSRRGRTLSLEALAAGVLLLYPRYFDPVTELPCTAEITLDRLADPALWQPTALIRARRAQGRMLARIANWRMRGVAGKTVLF